MSGYFMRRILQAVPTIFGITFLSFLLMLAAPGDPITYLTFNPGGSPEATERLRRQLGLDQPPLQQYVYWLIGNDWVTVDVDDDGSATMQGVRKGLLRGDLGQSIAQRRPVLDLIAERIPATLQLTLSALVLGYGLGIMMGLAAAAAYGGWPDQVIRFVSVLGTALPGFWLGLILIIAFGVQLRWLPIGGMRDITRPDAAFDLWDSIRHMIMPVSVLALAIAADAARYVRAEVLEVLEQDYVRTARAKGLAENAVFYRHIIRNALIPIATFIGPALGGLLGGAVIIEQVFSWPGMGRLIVNSVFQRDYPVVMGTVLVSAVLYIIGLLISDLLYSLLDPRVTYS
jgi:peptide/nickel transport system permease protein